MEDFLSKIGKFASDALFGQSAEARTVYANEEGEIPKSLPFTPQYTSFGQALNIDPEADNKLGGYKEPKSYEELKPIINRQI